MHWPGFLEANRGLGQCTGDPGADSMLPAPEGAGTSSPADLLGESQRKLPRFKGGTADQEWLAGGLLLETQTSDCMSMWEEAGDRGWS